MNHARLIKFLLCALGVLALFGCTPADPCDLSELVAPSIVVGTGPSQEEITDDLTPDFPWVASYECDIDGFQVEVALEGDFSTPGLTVGTTGPEARSWTPAVDLEPASHFQWRVAAVTDGEVGPYTTPRSFFTGPACGESQRWSVSLDSPSMGALVTDDNPPLDWSYPDASCQPEGYAFTVQEQPAGTTALSGQGGPYSGFETPISYLDDCTLYHWWVQPVIGGVTSENYIPSYFITDFSGSCPGDPCDPDSLVAPTPVSPANGAAWMNSSPVVSWNYAYPACQRNLGFYIEISTVPEFTGLFVYGNTAGGWMTFDPAAAQLQDCTTYYWRVAASQEGLGPYSEPWSFTTDFNGTCPGGACDVTALPAPTPVSPAEGADWAGTYPVVTWDYPHPGCESLVTFHAEVARDARFTDLVVYGDIPGQYDTFDPAAVVLDDCTTYYWHVAATTAGGQGPYSGTRTFRTNFSNACGRSSRGTIAQDAVCRGGPSLDYPIVLYLSRGVEVELTGRNADSTWLALIRPDGYGTCWIGARLVTAADDPAGLPVREAPPLVITTEEPTGEPVGPTPTASQPACSTYTSIVTCPTSRCRWIPNPQGGGGGVCRDP